ncbi:DUF4276 family protein, partial [Erwinia mallotivora]|uniref:DUF4276 family protein n=1 Tax=Erwinia mallotivora TaxID=69222 RepID=UPI0021BDF9A0
MHFEILVEGQAELTALSVLMPKIVGDYESPHTWKIHKHRGIGRLPDDLTSIPNINDNTLLHQLPSKLRAYSKIKNPLRRVIVLLDLDEKIIGEFKLQLLRLLECCEDGFKSDFIFAVEELESWYLGDRTALLKFNQNINVDILNTYIQDSICGTWELLAAAEDPNILKAGKRSSVTLDKKKEWSKKIPIHMDINSNLSPSFNHFRKILTEHISVG